VWSALAAVYLIWGSTYLAIRVMVRDVPPLLGASARFVVAGAALLLVLAARGPGGAGGPHVRAGGGAPIRFRPRYERVRISGRAMAAAALVGLLLPAGGNGIVTLAEKHVPSGLAALLVASVPLWVVLLQRTVAGVRVRAATLASVAVGFCGVGVLLLPGSRPAGATATGIALILIAAASWAAGSFAAPRLPLPADPLVSTGWQMLWGGVFLAVAGLAAGEAGRVHAAHIAADSWLALAYLITVGSLLAYSCYTWLLQHAPISQVSTYAYVNPLVAVVLGWAILGEQLGVGTLAGAAVIVASVAVTVRAEARSRERAPVRVREPAPTPAARTASRARPGCESA
jgi:drug/metabolite transporter (DMT)-like permease